MSMTHRLLIASAISLSSACQQADTPQRTEPVDFVVLLDDSDSFGLRSNPLLREKAAARVRSDLSRSGMVPGDRVMLLHIGQRNTDQGTKDHPVVLVIGGGQASWPKIVGALQQASFEGAPVRGIVLGPTDGKPQLEIYAQGTLVSKPIDPNTVTKEALTAAVRTIHREMYPTKLAARSSYEAHAEP
ncbi:hypothetical protein WG908_04440 [Sphingobium sp. AN641]|uniref:hypothetical protein n=1 Tax=Sphingobium sp. AN641 TaxID=3133443 RepID=UPI0030C1D3FD